MKKLLLILFITTTLFSDFINDFHSGKYANESQSYYALGSSNSLQRGYEARAMLDAKSSLARQLITTISSTQLLSSSSSRVDGVESISSSYSESSSLRVSNLPIIGTTTLNRKIKENRFYTLIKFDIKVVGPLYQKESNRLCSEIDTNYSFATSAKRLIQKEQLLKEVKNSYENYLTYSKMTSLMNYSHNKPKVTQAEVDYSLLTLYNQQSADIPDLARVLVSRLSLEKIDAPLEILPIGYEQKFHTTKFSHRLKHHLQNELYGRVEVTKAIVTPYKLIGTYVLEGDTLQVRVMIVNSKATIIDSSLALMRVKDASLFLAKEQEVSNPNEPYAIMESYFESW